MPCCVTKMPHDWSPCGSQPHPIFLLLGLHRMLGLLPGAASAQLVTHHILMTWSDYEHPSKGKEFVPHLGIPTAPSLGL